jgi:adenine-specific DNA-methyltransferase
MHITNNILAENLVINDENAHAMASLTSFGFGEQIDFMLWDPPYNTGNKHFLYEDNFYLTKKAQQEWEKNNSNASRHSKWLSFMEVRLDLAKKLLKETGVIAIHIGYQELFRLGLLMDEVFGEDNRIGIINWECAYSPKNDNKGIPSTTDYVLIYAKNKHKAFRGLVPRTEEMDARYKSVDGDKRVWASDNLSSMKNPESYKYGIENPFTGELHFPPENSYWRMPKVAVNELLCNWGIKYVINSQGNSVVKEGENREIALSIFKKGPWPKIYFLGKNGEGRPRLKRYKDELKNEGRVLGTYWEADEVLDETWQTDEQLNLSLTHEISGHNDGAKKLIKAILGDDCAFNTPKPLKLTERLIELFCPKDGIVLDAFGGSATTAHAVLDLNNQGATRKFILIEQAEFAETITAERIKRVINGNWAHPKKDTKSLGGSFKFIKGELNGFK